MTTIHLQITDTDSILVRSTFEGSPFDDKVEMQLSVKSNDGQLAYRLFPHVSNLREFCESVSAMCEVLESRKIK